MTAYVVVAFFVVLCCSSASLWPLSYVHNFPCLGPCSLNSIKVYSVSCRLWRLLSFSLIFNRVCYPESPCHLPSSQSNQNTQSNEIISPSMCSPRKGNSNLGRSRGWSMTRKGAPLFLSTLRRYRERLFWAAPFHTLVIEMLIAPQDFRLFVRHDSPVDASADISFEGRSLGKWSIARKSKVWQNIASDSLFKFQDSYGTNSLASQ